MRFPRTPKEIISFVLRALMLAYSIYGTYTEVVILNYGVFTESHLISPNCIRIPPVPSFCRPRVEFTLPSGEIFTYTFSLNQTFLYGGKLGSRVDILYDQNRPSQVLLNNIYDKWISLAFDIGVGLLAFYKNSRKKSPFEKSSNLFRRV